MKITNIDLIEDFYNKEIKESFPHLSMEEVREAIHLCWKFFRDEMENGNLPKISIKYFGTFQVHRARAVDMLNKIEERVKEGIISEKQYNNLKEVLTNYLERKDNDKEEN